MTNSVLSTFAPPPPLPGFPAGDSGGDRRKNQGGVLFLRTDYLLKSQLELVLAALLPDNRRALQVQLRTGLRIGDVLALRSDQIGRSFWVTESKTGKRRHVGLPDWLTSEIRRAAAGSEWAFPSPRDPGKHRTRQAVWKDLKRVSRALRIPVNVGTHSMRKAYAVDLMHKYADLDFVRRDLSHDNASVTVLYAMADVLTQTAASRKVEFKRRR